MLKILQWFRRYIIPYDYELKTPVWLSIITFMRKEEEQLRVDNHQ